MSSIFDKVEREQKEHNREARKKAVINFTKDKFDRAKDYIANKNVYKYGRRAENVGVNLTSDVVSGVRKGALKSYPKKMLRL